MKKTVKFISMAIAVVMSLTMFASAISLDALIKPITSYEAKGTFYMTLNKPMELLSHPEVVEAINGAAEPFGIDVALLVESLFDTKMNYDLKMNMSPDYKKGEFYAGITYNVPAELDDKFSIETDGAVEMWVEYDFSDLEKPAVKVIYDYPLTSKYVVIDLADLPAEVFEDESFKQTMAVVAELLDPETIAKQNKYGLDLVLKHASINKRINRIEISLDNEGFAAFAGDIFATALDLAAQFYGDSADDISEMKSVIPALLSSFKLLGENGIKYEFIFNQVGIIKSERVAVDVDFNLYNILTGLGIPAEFLGIVTEDNSSLAFTAYAEYDYSRVNGDVSVEFPVLTDENTFKFVSEVSAPVTPEDYYPEVEKEYNDISVDSDVFFMDGTALYFPYEALLDEYNLTTSNSVIFEQVGPQLKADVRKVTLTKDGNTVEVALNDPVIEKDGVVYVSAAFVTDVFGQKLSYIGYDPEWGISIYYYEGLLENVVIPEQVTLLMEAETK